MSNLMISLQINTLQYVTPGLTAGALTHIFYTSTENNTLLVHVNTYKQCTHTCTHMHTHICTLGFTHMYAHSCMYVLMALIYL